MSVGWPRAPGVEKGLLGLLLVGLVGYWVLRSGTRGPRFIRHRLVSKGSLSAQQPSQSAGIVQPFLEPLNPSGRSWDLTKCNRCAIVGNTGLLLHSYLKSRIDATNCIFRFGFAPTQKPYSRDVGEHTTVRLVDSTSFRKADPKGLDTLRDAYHVVIFDTERTSQPVGKLDVESLFTAATQVWRLSAYGVRRAYTLLKEEISRHRMDITASNPSALWLAFLLAYDAQCLQTQVFGIPGPDYCRFRSHGFVPYHYWNLQSEAMCEAPVGTELPSRHETEILWSLSLSYNLTYDEPRWS